MIKNKILSSSKIDPRGGDLGFTKSIATKNDASNIVASYFASLVYIYNVKL